MNEKDIRRLLKSNPKLVQYCIDRILKDDETAKILNSINKVKNKADEKSK